jgi:hypothetical protein
MWVFSVFVKAPLKPIIADIARPPMIFSTGCEEHAHNGWPAISRIESRRTWSEIIGQ